MSANCQRHCKSRNVRTKRCGGADTSNLPKPYSEFPKICQTVPIVFIDIPTVPGGGLGTTVTGQPTESSSDSPSGDTNLFRTGSAIPKAVAAILCASCAWQASDDRVGTMAPSSPRTPSTLGKMKVQWQVRGARRQLILLYASFLRPFCWLFDKKIFCFFSTFYCRLQPSWCCTTTSPCFSLGATILRRNLPPPQPAPTPAPRTPTK